MTSKKLVLPTIVIAIVSTLTACGGGSASTRTAPPPALSIALQTGLPTSLGVSTGLQIAANVSNDPGNAGVDGTATCGSSDCGSFSAAHTTGGTATTYTSPTVVPASGSVVVTATSTKNSAQKASAAFTIKGIPDCSFISNCAASFNVHQRHRFDYRQFGQRHQQWRG